MMKQLIIYLIFLACSALADDYAKSEVVFISPHGITREREVHDSLPTINQHLQINTTTYAHDSVNYTISNVTIELGFNDGKQKIQILDKDDVNVFGGIIQFLYNFNYSKKEGGQVTTGYGFGSVYSNSLNYSKELTFGHEGYLIWQLVPKSGEQKQYTNLTIENKMHIKRLEPYSEADHQALQSMLDGAVQVQPSTIRHQILDQFNQQMPKVLDETLKKQVVTSEIEYQFHSPSKGPLNVTFVHNSGEYSVDKQNGYKVEFGLAIKGEQVPVCTKLPENHLIFQLYGGRQNLHDFCLYDHVLKYIQKQGWLDTDLDRHWECNSFQFYAGDLFDLINNLYLKVNPRQLLEGKCVASNKNLSIRNSRDIVLNVWEVKITYNCSASSKDKNRQNVQVLNFHADVEIFVKVSASQRSINLEVMKAQAVDIDFIPVGDFYVNNLDLAMFKVDEVLKKLQKNKVFGDGFPIIPLEHPKVHMNENYTLFYDPSHVSQIYDL